MRKLVYGVGVNDADYVVQVFKYISKRNYKIEWLCPYYDRWKGMLCRAFSESKKKKSPTYADCSVCNEWLTFSSFKNWMQEQDWEGKQLDKDIIVPSNKLYSPETCAFVHRLTNTFIIDRGAARGRSLIGVHLTKRENKYMAYCSNPFDKRLEHLGNFLCEASAHEAWRKRKHELAQLVAETETDSRVKEALKKRYSKEEWYK